MEENSRDLNDILTEKDEPSDQIISSMTVNKSCLKEVSRQIYLYDLIVTCSMQVPALNKQFGAS